MAQHSVPHREGQAEGRAQPPPETPEPLLLPPSEDELRRVAIARLKKKRDFRSHAFVYIVMNIAFWAAWAINGAANTWDFPWPVFPTVIWGLFVLGHARDLYWRDPLREDLVQREIEGLRAASRIHPLDTYELDDDWC